MSQVKTAISVEEGIFKQLNAFAHKIHVSRSKLFEIAAKEWLKAEQRKRLIGRINKAVEKDHLDAEDKRQAGFMRAQHRKLVDGAW